MSSAPVHGLGLPRLGATVPGWVVRAAFGVVGIGLAVACYQPPFWIAVGAALTGYSIAEPRRLTPWVLLAFLAASQLARDPAPLDWRFMGLLAGLQLLHLLAANMRQLQWRARAQLAAFARPLLRLVAIQVPVQLVAIVVLALLAPASGSDRRVLVPVLGIAGGGALVVATLVLLVPLVRDRR